MEENKEVALDNLSLAAAILAFYSVSGVGLSLLIESYGNVGVRSPNRINAIICRLLRNVVPHNDR